MGEVINCRICGKVFQSGNTSGVCQDCMTRDELDYQKLREYLEFHPRASIYEVATNLDITINKIKHYLREGRIEIVESDNQFLKCECCGKPIHTGRYCDSCFRLPHDTKPNNYDRSHPDTTYAGVAALNASANETSSNKSENRFNYRSKR